MIRFLNILSLYLFVKPLKPKTDDMKRLVLVLLLLPLFASAQQLLWTTMKKDSTDSKYIPLERVPNEVLNLYRTYSRFYDGSGFTKDAYINMFVEGETSRTIDIGDNSSFKNVIVKIQEPTVFAFKLNDGSGSYASVVYVDKKDVDVIVFSNSLIMAEMEHTGPINVDRFKNLFNNIFKNETINQRYVDPLAANYGDNSSGYGNALLSVENRRFVVPPKIEDNGQLSGKIAVEVRVDRDGKIISARAGVRGTTITNNELFEKCERAALGAQLNRLEKAPPVQSGVIVFSFKIDYKSQ